MERTKPIRIGNAGGYWGDDPHALKRQVEGGHLDYITMDFLAEVTMSIMQKQRSKNPSTGYARDFLVMLEPVLVQVLKQKTKIITNAGGVNPLALAGAIEALGVKLGVTPKIAVVHGDDILSDIPELQKKGAAFRNMENNSTFDLVDGRIESANIYFGATAVVEALKWNPDIIITGRVTDTGITVAPMIFEFGWDAKDWNKVASGMVAGHMLECGCQITGGNFSDWTKVTNFHEIGYPIAEVYPDGSFVLTKHEGTGGLVSLDTVREQLFYEMGNPKAYITPDVVVDFSSIEIAPDGPHRVKVSHVQGHEPTPFYKVSMAYRDGYKATGSIMISGPNARAKAETFSQIFWKRLSPNFLETSTEFIGWNSCHRSLGHQEEGNEILLRLSARAVDESSLQAFGKMIPSLILSGPPGVAVIGGVPKPQEVVSYWPALMNKDLVHPKISLWQNQKVVESKTVTSSPVGNFTPPADDVQTASSPNASVAAVIAENTKSTYAPLYAIALARSGDKGDMANIGVLARSPLAYKFICETLSAQTVKNWFQELCKGKVTRYRLDKLQGLNFLLDEALGGGGTMTLRTDAQGKTFSQALLRQRVAIPNNVLEDVKRYESQR
ncbi:MAG: acyclic terpene utilization AtuA family protein [Pseudomonadota bacterium]